MPAVELNAVARCLTDDVDGHLHGAGQQLFYAFLTEQIAKAPELRLIAGPAVLEILVA